MPTDAQVREAIVKTAMKYVGSQSWKDATPRGHYPANSNKCNLFVYEVLTAAGASPGLPHGHWWSSYYPPLAGDWASAGYDIPHWRLLAPKESPEPGDVVAQRINYSDASGHTMIVGPHGTVVGTGDQGNGPHGTIEMIQMPVNLGPDKAVAAPKVFRRFDSAVR